MDVATHLRSALALHRSGQITRAEAVYRQIVRDHPENADALHLLGMLCSRTGRLEEAITLLSQAVEADPSVAEFQNNLGSALGRMGRPAEAQRPLREAIRLRPDYAEAHLNLGISLEEIGNLDDAKAAYARAVALKPGWATARRRFGGALRNSGWLDEAEAELREAIALAPQNMDAYSQLANVYGALGKLDQAIESYRQSMELPANPATPAAHSDYLHLLHYHPRSSRAERFAEARRWARRHAGPLRTEIKEHKVDGSSRRRLRVGFVSPDFREHPVARLMLPVLQHLDRDRFETVCYSDATKPDAMTARLSNLAHTWRQTGTLSDDGLCALIRDERIDILVDLCGHMAGHRLLCFARKPAPVQVTHFNYPDTTGLDAMGWRIVDDLACPPDLKEDAFSSERLIRLGPCAWCYDPGEPTPPVAPTPAIANGYVTFGCLNKMLKVTEPAIALWSEILRRTPGSKLMLLSADRSNRHLASRFELCGISADRLLLATPRPRFDFLALFNSIDIALDPFPYNGGITTCDGLWMGVPHVTVAGESYHSRQGVMLLTNIGLGELIGQDHDDYLKITTELGGSRDRLIELRRTMRDRLAGSVICDAHGFAGRLKEAFERIWASHSAARSIPAIDNSRDTHRRDGA